MMSNVRRAGLLVILGFVGLLWAGVSMDCVGLDGTGATSLRFGPPVVPPASPSTLRPSVVERLAKIDGRFRLPPDARVLRALAELERLARGSETDLGSDLPKARYRDGRWEIFEQDRALGTLPELSGFDAILALLQRRAEGLRNESGVLAVSAVDEVLPELAQRLEQFDELAALDVLARVDVRMREGRASVGDLRAASSAFAQLSIIALDQFQLADELNGRALAMLALARSYGSEAVARAEALLALSLGYSSHAKSVSANFPASDPIRAYLDNRLEDLRVEAGVTGTPETRFLFGLALAREVRLAEWTEWMQGLGEPAFAPALLRTYAAVPDVSSARWLPDALLFGLQTRLGLPPPAEDAADVAFARMGLLERRIREEAETKSGCLVSPGLYRSFYRALSFSALYQKFDYYHERLSSEPALLQFAGVLAKSEEPDVRAVGEFARLMATRQRSPASVGHRHKALEDPSVLGARQRYDLSLAITATMFIGYTETTEIVDRTLAFLDSRTDHTFLAALMAQSPEFDPVQRQRLEESIVRRDIVERGYLRMALAAGRRDEKQLWSTLEEQPLSRLDRIQVLQRIREIEGFDRERVVQAFEREIARTDASYRAFSAFASLLSSDKDYAGARRVWRAFLEHPATFPGIQRAHAVAKLAATSRLDGDADEAWKLVEPWLDSYVGAVMLEGVSAQVERGDLDGAEQIARRALGRYPDGWYHVTALARVLWLRGQPVEAARIIAEARGAQTSDAWTRVATAFESVFDESRAEAMEEAYAELVKRDLPWSLLQEVVEVLRQKQRYERAFAVGQLIHDPERQILLYTELYKSLASARGRDEAITWLRDVLPTSWYDVSAKLFYMREADDLLWLITSDPEAGHGGSRTWLLRAAAQVRAESPDPAHRAALIAHYTERDSDFIDVLGGALVGLHSEEDVFARVRSESELCEAASFLALRAEHAGRLADAVRLYHLAVSVPYRDLAAYTQVSPALQRLMERWYDDLR